MGDRWWDVDRRVARGASSVGSSYSTAYSSAYNPGYSPGYSSSYASTSSYSPAYMYHPRTDRYCGNVYRNTLYYDLLPKVQPIQSQRFRIVGGDVVPGLGIVHRTHPSTTLPSYSYASPYSCSYQQRRLGSPRLASPPPPDHFRSVTSSGRSWRSRSPSPSAAPTYSSFTPVEGRSVLFPRQRTSWSATPTSTYRSSSHYSGRY